MRAAAAALVSALSIAWLPLVAPAAEPGSTLRRPDDVVVFTGKELPKMRGADKRRLRLYAFTHGELRPVPLQVDERAPQHHRYCFDHGSSPVSDVDEGRIDDDDEVVFAAVDAGARAPAGTTLPDVVAGYEIELEDPRDHGRGWVYLFRFEVDPPPEPTLRHLSFDVDKDGVARFSGDGFELELGRGSSRLSFVSPTGERRPFGDLARLRLDASYRGLPIERDPDEIRIATGSWLAGPVRALVEVTVESYLIWGSWVTTTQTSPVATLTRRSLVVPVTLSLPVRLDDSPPSSLSLSLALDDKAEGVRLFTSGGAGPVPFEGGGEPEERAPERAVPEWIVAGGAHGGVIVRLVPRTEALRRPSNRLELAARPARLAGFRLDLSELTRGEYAADYSIHVVPRGKDAPALDRDAAARIVEAADRPLERRVR